MQVGQTNKFLYNYHLHNYKCLLCLQNIEQPKPRSEYDYATTGHVSYQLALYSADSMCGTWVANILANDQFDGTISFNYILAIQLNGYCQVTQSVNKIIVVEYLLLCSYMAACSFDFNGELMRLLLPEFNDYVAVFQPVQGLVARYMSLSNTVS